MIEPVRAVIEEHLSRELAACDRLRDFAIGMKAPWGGRSIDMDSPHEQLLAMIFSRSLNTFWSSVELTRIGFALQAAMLNRSLFEDAIDAHWITVEPELAAQRVEEHYLHGKMLLAGAMREEGVADEEIPTFDAADRTRLDKIFGKYGERSWTGLTLYARVMAVEHLWDAEGRKHLHFYRRLVHREANQLLHLSAFAMREQVRSRTPEEMRLSLGPTGRYTDKALAAAAWTYIQILSLIRDTFEFGDDEAWQQVHVAPFEFPAVADDT
jgi:hypothetical protein